MSINTLLEPLKADIEAVESHIFSALNTEIPLLNDVARHIVDSGGKRLRPALTITAARMFHFPGDAVYRAASSLEYLHTATLLHDDVVDGSDTRRAKKAARMIWGNPASVLVGDYLLATAFRTLTELGNLDVLQTISETTSMMAKGEILQLIRQYHNATEEEYMAIIIHKTACLFAAAGKVGAVFGGAKESEQQALYEYGNKLGIAFQIVDDALDFVEDRSKVGKPLGVDLKEKKITLPLSRLLKVASVAEEAKLQKILASEEISDEQVQTVVNMMNDHKVLPYVLEQAKKQTAEGKINLADLPDCPERKALGELADYVVDREF